MAACRSLILCLDIGLVCIGHSDGSVRMRLTPTTDRLGITHQPGEPPVSMDIPELEAQLRVRPLPAPGQTATHFSSLYPQCIILS